jgi:ATP-dependent Zn protease
MLRNQNKKVSELARTEEDYKKSAYHEDCHVVAALEMGIYVCYTTIRPRGREYGIKGNTVLRLRKKSGPGREGYIICILAGSFAELLLRPDDHHLGSNQDIDEIRNSGDDFEKIKNALDVLFNSPEERENYFLNIDDKTEKLIKSNSEAVKSIAEALLEKRTLTGKEAKEIYLGVKYNQARMSGAEKEVM